MLANVAFLAALTTFLGVAWLAGELSFLARFKGGIFREHGATIGSFDRDFRQFAGVHLDWLGAD